MRESMAAQPTAGGDAPLYRARTPSPRTVLTRQSHGPANWEAVEVWRRTLIVSNGCPTERFGDAAEYAGDEAIIG